MDSHIYGLCMNHPDTSMDSSWKSTFMNNVKISTEYSFLSSFWFYIFHGVLMHTLTYVLSKLQHFLVIFGSLRVGLESSEGNERLCLKGCRTIVWTYFAICLIDSGSIQESPWTIFICDVIRRDGTMFTLWCDKENLDRKLHTPLYGVARENSAELNQRNKQFGGKESVAKGRSSLRPTHIHPTTMKTARAHWQRKKKSWIHENTLCGRNMN